MNAELIFAKSFVSVEILEQEWIQYQKQKTRTNFREYLASKNKISSIAKTIIDKAIDIRNLQFLQDSELTIMYQKYIEYIQKQLSIKQNYCDFTEWLHLNNLLNIGRYRIIDQIGKGGFGKVYKAYDSELSKYVAIKMLLNLNNWERFKREMKICANLEHPNIVPVFDCGKHNSIPYMIMKFVPGEPLNKKIKKRIREDKIKEIVGKIAMAVAVAHEKNIIHRDLKPSNIIISEDDEPVILDFGIARIIDQETIGKTNEIIGSIRYMAPEALTSGEVSKTSDIYSLGVILYQMLTTKNPYQATNTNTLMYEIINKEVSFENFPNISKPMQEICLKAMNKEPDKRFSSAKKFAEILLQRNSSERNTTKAFIPKATIHAPRKSKTVLNKKLLWIAILSVFLVFISVIFLFFSPRVETHPPLFYYDNELITTRLHSVSAQKNLVLDIPKETFFYLFDKDTKLDDYFLDSSQHQRKISIPLKRFNSDTHWYYICLNRALQAEEISTIFKKLNQRGMQNLEKYYNSNRQIEDAYSLYFSEISSNFAIKARNKFLISPSPFIINLLIKTDNNSKFMPLKKENVVKKGDILKIRIEAIFPNHHLLIFIRDNLNQFFPIFPPSKKIENTELYEIYHPHKKIIYIPEQYAKIEGFVFDNSIGKEHIIVVYSKNSINIEEAKIWMQKNDLSEYIKKSFERGVDFGNYYKKIQKPEFSIDIFEIDHQ